ncbi:MAG: zinc-binding dehydrogenase, partial [Bacteroidota bacterium]
KKHDICEELGASLCIDYKTENFAKAIKKKTGGAGVDVLIDFIAAPYLQDNLDVLNTDGRMILLAVLGGVKVDSFNLFPLLVKRLSIMGSTLRARSRDYKIKLTKDLYNFAWPLFEQQTLKPIIDSIFPWTEVADAHRYMEANKNKGKIILRVD